MSESPIERQQREFVEQSRKIRPAKTAGSEYVAGAIMGIFILGALLVMGIILFS